jgi:hypothetical protein
MYLPAKPFLPIGLYLAAPQIFQKATNKPKPPHFKSCVTCDTDPHVYPLSRRQILLVTGSAQLLRIFFLIFAKKTQNNEDFAGPSFDPMTAVIQCQLGTLSTVLRKPLTDWLSEGR